MIDLKYKSLRSKVAFTCSSNWTLILLALFMAECLFIVMNVQKVRIDMPAIPLTFGLAKDMVDVILVVLFPWHGWVFFIPLIVSAVIDKGINKLPVIYLLSTVTTAIVGSYFNFAELSLQKIIAGMLTYAAINLCVAILLYLIKFSINGVVKCLK